MKFDIQKGMKYIENTLVQSLPFPGTCRLTIAKNLYFLYPSSVQANVINIVCFYVVFGLANGFFSDFKNGHDLKISLNIDISIIYL